MGDSKLLGCWGVVIGLFTLLVLGWMTLDLLLATLGVLGTDGLGGLADVGIWREVGQLLVVGAAVIGLYAALFRPASLTGRLPSLRALLWTGAALSLMAWVRMAPGARGATWLLFLAVVGVLSPLLLARLARSDR